MMDPRNGNREAIVDSECGALFFTRQRDRKTRESKQMTTRPRRRSRQCCSKERIQSPSTTSWMRHMFAISLIAALTPTNGGAASVCDAFVTSTRKSTIAIRSEQWRISKNENGMKTHGAATIPIPIHRKMRASTSLSSTGSASPNNMSGNSNNNNQNKAEIAGFFLAVAIILSLAGFMSGPSDQPTSSSVAVMTKVVENTVPTTSTEVVAVTLGESIGGVIGAIFSVAINFVMRGGKVNDDSSKPSASETKKSKKSLLSQGLADSDYFIANSASNSLLEAAGVPETIAKYSSVFIAAIPSQLVKIMPNLSERNSPLPIPDDQQRKEPSGSLNAILSFWNSDKKKDGTNSKRFFPMWAAAATAGEAASSSITTESTAAAAASGIDFVKVFADVTRWLEYDVLKTEYGETALSQLWMVGNNLSAINPLQSAITFALLGSLAAVSSRWYADCLYGRFRYGPIEKQREVRKRSSAEWFSAYSSTAASAAALFGCYEFFQLPIGRYILGTLSGGVEGCVGSSNFDACMQTFIDTNSPGPSPEAQVRALITNLYAVYIRLQDIAGDTTADDMAALIRAWSVSFASYIANM